MKKLVLTKIDHKQYAFYFENDKLTELDVNQAASGSEGGIGQIFMGRVQKILPNIQAAFVEYAKGKTGFLPLADLGDRKDTLKCGQELPIQIEKAAVKTKDPVLSTKLSLSGIYTVVQLYDNRIGYSAKLSAERKEELKAAVDEPLKQLRRTLSDQYGVPFGIVIRTGTENPEITGEQIINEAKKISKDLLELYRLSASRTLYSELTKQASFYLQKYYAFRQLQPDEIITDDASAYEEILDESRKDGLKSEVRLYTDETYPLSALYSLKTRLDEAVSPKVWLRCGGFLIIEETEALAVIDVNSGKNISGKERESTFQKINKEAAVESARQIRLRNLSGIIIIDFINCKENEEYIETLKKEFLKDPVKTYFVDRTPLGLVEITRQKKTAPLREKMERLK